MTVIGGCLGDRVYIKTRKAKRVIIGVQEFWDYSSAELTPYAARKLAQALLAAANNIDGESTTEKGR
ncbi:MAG: hypothetical protein GXY83_15545 [Rhodopirellula sp.]|nr:hypothetical protein [Rhodopirellula sp.]